MIADYPMVIYPSYTASNIIGPFIFWILGASIEANSNANGGNHIPFNGVIDERLKEQMSEYPFSVELEEKKPYCCQVP